MRLVDSPWVTNPSPRSFVQPNAYRVVKWLRRPTDLPRNYPYREHPDKPTMIPYHEWRGEGCPPMDVGYPGDVYVNMTPGKYSLYGRTKTGWAQWTGLNYEKWQRVHHPLLDDRYLFCSETDIKWYSLSAIRNMRRGRDNSISISKAIEIVRSQGHPKDGLNPCSRPGKRKRVENDMTEDDEEDTEEEIRDQSVTEDDEEDTEEEIRDQSVTEDDEEDTEEDIRYQSAKIQRLEKEIKNLKRQNVGLPRDDEYRGLSFDDLCVRVRTADERVSAAHRVHVAIESNLKAELNAVSKIKKATETKLEAAVNRSEELEAQLAAVEKERGRASREKHLMQVQRDIALQKAEDAEAKYNDLHSKLNQLITG